MHLNRHQLWLSAAFVSLLILVFSVYQPALKGPFLLDDFDNLRVMENPVVDGATLRDYLATGNAGPLGRPIAKLTFLLDDNAWPSSPENFKRTNLYIHILVGVFVFIAFRLMLGFVLSVEAANWVALLLAAFFLLHPLQVSTSMYIVQRMTQLAGLFVMLGVSLHVYWRKKYPVIGYRELFLITITQGLCGALAVLSKESGVLLPVFLLVVEGTLLSRAYAGRLYQQWVRLCLVVPVAGLVAYLLYLPRWLTSYVSRDFGLVQRLLTEPVILMDYLYAILSMKVVGLGLFHDDYPIYTDILNPKPLLSIVFLVASLILAVAYRRRFPVVCFGMLWFLAGHMLESTTISLELYFEHRNYIPMLGPVLVVAYLIYCGFQRVSDNLAKVAPILAVAVLMIAAMSTHGLARDWSSVDRLIPRWAQEHPDSLRAQRTYAHLLAVKGLPGEALDVLDRAYIQAPHDLSLPLISLDISCFFNLPRRYSPEDLVVRAPEHRFTDGLRIALTEYAAKLLDHSCAADVDTLHALFSVLPSVQKIKPTSSLVAVFSLLDGQLYYKEKRWIPALSAFLRVDELKPTVDSALRLTALYIFLQDYNLARDFLVLAQQRNERRSGWRYKYSDAEFKVKFDMIDVLDGNSPIKPS